MAQSEYDPAPMELTAGTEVDGWVVEGVLGRGAMATVYAVRHEVLGLQAALKVLGQADATLEQRLVHEGRAQGTIGHPGIVGVMDHLWVQGHAALLLERVEDGDLARLLAAGPLSLETSLDLFRQITSALSAAHAAGLVHRDLKPSNVLLRRTGSGWTAKVGDFGLVKTVNGELTASHGVVGTPRYMAPEQMRAARRVDVRADLFSLGCLLYELVTGRQAFAGDDWVGLYAAKEAGRFVDPRALVPDLPAPVASAITGCLQASLARRIPSCAALLGVLDGEPWEADSGDTTLDLDGGSLLCPGCGAPSLEPEADDCGACGVPLALAGRYRLVEQVSVSPATRVYRALDLKDGEFVLVRACVSADRLGRERFRRGAVVGLQLDHPQIARGRCAPFEEHGSLWEVRVWVDGRSLADELAVKRFSEAEVLRVIEGLCAPLAYLAERSPPVVHRAVGPTNVLRTLDGSLVLIDLAQVRDQVADASLHDVPAGAPEQWVGEASPATDVYGLGTLATILLTRQAGHTLAHRDELRGVAIGADLRELLARMRAEDPADRPSVAEVARHVRGLPTTGRTLAPRSRAVPGRLAWLGLSAALLLVGLGVWAVATPVAAPDLPVLATTDAPPSPEHRRVPSPDLADRPIPGADCGPAFQATVLLADGDTPSSPLVAVTCDGRAHALGTIEPQVPLRVGVPGEGRVGLPWERALVPAETSASTVTLRSTLARVSVLEGEQPLTRGTATPARADAWAVDSRGRPLLSQPVRSSEEPWFPASVAQPIADDGTLQYAFGRSLALEVDGVYRTTFVVGTTELRVAPVVTVRQVRVTAADDSPLADAEVLCLPGQPEPDAGPVRARTDAEGRARCGSSGAPHRWALADAEGFVAEVSELAEGEVRIVLEPARRVLVGCHADEGGGCDLLAQPPVCAGSAGTSSGICRRIGESFACECAADATRIQHGVLGWVALPEGATGAWYDLRTIEGTVSGRLDGGTGRCSVELRTPLGGLTTRVDGGGGWRLGSVPEGGYEVEARCGGRPVSLGTVRVTAEAPHPVLATVQAPGRVTLVVDRRATEEQVGPERRLEDFSLPAWPGGADPGVGPVTCAVETTIGADGLAARVAARGCPQVFASAAEAAVRDWRWAAGDEVTESLLVRFDPERR